MIEARYDTSKDKRLEYISKKFLYKAEDFNALHHVFCKIDVDKSGTISLEDMFNFLQEELNSIISPYLVYLFSLIEKESDNRVTFLEWLPAISVYCLYSKN